jgi:hypothetical protein
MDPQSVAATRAEPPSVRDCHAAVDLPQAEQHPVADPQNFDIHALSVPNLRTYESTIPQPPAKHVASFITYETFIPPSSPRNNSTLINTVALGVETTDLLARLYTNAFQPSYRGTYYSSPVSVGIVMLLAAP